MLNARGTELLAIDLVKNLVFRLAEERCEPVDDLYETYWHQFDTDDWRTEVRVGRLMKPRADQFFTYWLVMKTASDVHSQQLFPTFRKLLAEGTGEVTPVIKELAHYASVYDSFSEYGPRSFERPFFARMDELDVSTFMPLMLLLFGAPEAELSAADRRDALAAIESWLVRRMLCRLSTRLYNKITPAMIERIQGNLTHASEVVIGSLRAMSGDNACWPTDEAVRHTLTTRPTYGMIRQSRVVMVLAAIEQRLRSGKTEQLEQVRSLSIEHVLPQKWQTHWPLPDTADRTQAVPDRDEAVHLLGNLTLLTEKLNASQSNSAWPRKRQLLEETLAAQAEQGPHVQRRVRLGREERSIREAVAS